jgi:hypothetical protein
MFEDIESDKLSAFELQDLAETNSPNGYIIGHKPMKKIASRLNMFKINFKNKFKEEKQKPKSKRKSFIIGFTTVVGIVLFGPVLSAVAKEIPQGTPKPTDIAIAPPPPTGKTIINNAASTVCSLAVTSGSFVVGAACGLLVVMGILHVQGKPLFHK